MASVEFEIFSGGRLTPAIPASVEYDDNFEDNESSAVVGAKSADDEYVFGMFNEIITEISANKRVPNEINFF
tara:strand:- start:697 stop:912 length:216 start_codon:yes stop_codon:yes gene_type:complete